MFLPLGRLLLVLLLTLAALPARSEPPADKKPTVRLDHYGDPLPEGAIARLGTVRLRHARSRVSGINFVADSKTFIALGNMGEVRLWDAATGKEIRRFEDQDQQISAVALSPDGKTLLTGGYRDGGATKISLWDITTGRKKRDFLREDVHVPHTMTFSPDGKTFAWVGFAGVVRLWDAASGKEIRQFDENVAMVDSVTFSPDGKRLAATAQFANNTIRLWEVATSKEVGKIGGREDEDAVRYSSTGYSPDGKILVSAGADTLCWWDAVTLKEIRKFPKEGAFAFSPDGKTMASANSDKTIRLRDVPTGRELRQLLGSHKLVQSIAFSRDGKTLVSGSEDATLRIWDVATGKQLHPLDEHTDALSSIAMSPDVSILATGSYDGTIRLWQSGTWKQYLTLRGHEDKIHSVAFSPNGKTMASASEDKTVRLWDMSRGQELHRFQGHTGAVHSVAFSPDGKSLASASLDNTIRLWDVATTREIRKLKGHAQGVWSVAFTPDGKTLASGGQADGLWLWDVPTGKPLRHLLAEERIVTSIGISCNGQILASGIQDMCLWDNRPERGPRRLKSWGHSVAFSPDGRTMAAGDGMGTIQLWEVASAKEIQKFVRQGSWIGGIVFSPGGQFLISANSDTTALVWDLSPLGWNKEAAVKSLTPQTLDKLWADLAEENAARAYSAIWTLAAAPEQALPLLKSRVATRYEKTARNFLAFVQVAAIMVLLL